VIDAGQDGGRVEATWARWVDAAGFDAGALKTFHAPFILTRLAALTRLSLSKRYLKRGRFLRVIPDLLKLF